MTQSVASQSWTDGTFTLFSEVARGSAWAMGKGATQKQGKNEEELS